MNLSFFFSPVATSSRLYAEQLQQGPAVTTGPLSAAERSIEASLLQGLLHEAPAPRTDLQNLPEVLRLTLAWLSSTNTKLIIMRESDFEHNHNQNLGWASYCTNQLWGIISLLQVPREAGTNPVLSATQWGATARASQDSFSQVRVLRQYLAHFQGEWVFTNLFFRSDTSDILTDTNLMNRRILRGKHALGFRHMQTSRGGGGGAQEGMASIFHPMPRPWLLFRDRRAFDCLGMA